MEIEHDWRIRPGVHGRKLNRLLPADIWEQWSRLISVRKLFRTIELFRRVARQVGGALVIHVPETIGRWGGGLSERGETFLL